jgi:CBS domain containing-hemolysin-like protein
MMPSHTLAAGRLRSGSAVRSTAVLFALVLTVLFPGEARASFLSPELEDKLATFLALFIIFVVPVVLIALFWMVHVLPEKIAHKRHHPQFEAIRTLCLLSLVFGGLLWPIAWIWAYSKPVMHKLAYGTDKASHEEQAHGEAWDEGKAEHEGGLGLNDSLKDRLARLEQRGVPPSEMKALRADLEALEAKYAHEEAR